MWSYLTKRLKGTSQTFAYIGIVGGFAKMLTYYERNYCNPGDNIISYCNLEKFTGISYCRQGFQEIRQTYPGYSYTKDYRKIENRMKYQKLKLFNLLGEYDNSLTESANMFKNEYDRIWDCGNSVFIKQLPNLNDRGNKH